MAGTEETSKPFPKCQSCGEISSTPQDKDNVVKMSKSHSMAEIEPLKVPVETGEANATFMEKTEEPTGDEVWCDFCLETKVKAVKTCLTCMVNYCTTHLRPHLDNPKLHTHQLVPPVNDAALRSCSLHNKPLDWFCKEHLICVCEECAEGDHKDHNPIPCSKARKQVETEVQEMVTEYDFKLKCAENAIVKLEANTTSIQNSVAEAKRTTDLQFQELQDAVKNAHSKVLEFLEQRERAAINQSIGIKTHLEQQCNEIRKIKAKVEGIAKHTNEFCFLQEYCEFKKAAGDDTLPSVYIGFIDKLSGIRKVLKDSTTKVIHVLQTSYMDNLQEFAKEEDVGMKTMVSAIMSKNHKLTAPDPSTREDFLKYKTNVTLDPVTAHCFLRLLQNNRKVNNVSPWQQSYPEHPERFEHWRQVLSEESFYMGRHYFEAEFKGEVIYIGMTYNSIDRKGTESNSNITGNDFSWTLKWNGKEFSAWHSDVETPLKKEKFSRIGVYIDYQRGTVAFYGVKDTMTLLHRFEGTFSEPLYAAFWLPKKESSVTIISPDDMAQSVPSMETKVLTATSKETIMLTTSKTDVLINTTVQTIKVETSSSVLPSSVNK
ncbi:tripartite motif-containing protein 16-like protein isoform X1 [Bufo gargarizans]|uniref:tripartite motif-containing protein 16-like protein isoform X1 n=1 Tax=Bufo gargarizans TaxID=30331 RepID=UPI001CF55667|nr:tripartite motif-containing protein 16-like protein isoform X1 [Bufo gargarizans]